MSATRSWRYRPTQDQLLIFVSSRIQECKVERSAVSKAIRSLHHQPVLFEHLGAKPYSPRDLYLSRLRDSQAMIAIYRSGYGFIDQANSMDISGLEDEYEFAKREQIDTLFYIFSSAENREPRLQALIDKIATGPTFDTYDAPDQLYDKVRQALTSWITEKVFSAPSEYGALQEGPNEVLARTLATAGVLLRRDDVLNLLKGQLARSPITCVHGPAGIGKTTIAAQLAQDTGARFVRASGLTPRDIFAVCADILDGRPADQPTPFSSLDAARLALAAVWSQLRFVTLILDECDYIPEVVSALSMAGATGLDKRLVYTSREESRTHPNIEVPPLTAAEVTQILAKSPWYRGERPERLAGGNPLQIQHQLMRTTAPFSTTGPIATGSAGEILTYLALSPLPLTIEQLLSLRSDESYSIQHLLADIELFGPIVDDSPRGYRLMHAETALSISERVRESPQRYRFFLNRLLRLMERTRQYRYAYELARSLNSRKAGRLASRAIMEAARLGDWRTGVALIDRMLNEALDVESKSDAFYLMLSLVYPLELMGNAARADEILERARQIGEGLGDGAQQRLQEIQLSSRARRAMLSNDILGLEAVYHRYGEQGNKWDQARLGLELSAIYIAARRHQPAVEVLRPTLAAFIELGDEYGADLSRRNLASALTAIPGSETEADELIAEISQEGEDQADTRRQRAWLCNVLTRRLRTAGRLSEAENLAKEALAIAIELGDESLRAINQINLGNVYRDQKQAPKAIEAYEEAAIASRGSGRRDIEADASRLVAGVYNDFEDLGEERVRSDKARLYAEHAIGLIRGTLNYAALASASWELGEALEALGRKSEAADAMFASAASSRMVPDEEDFARSLTYAAWLSLQHSADVYLSGLATALDLKGDADPEAPYPEQLMNLFVPLIKTAPKGALIRLLGLHLGKVWSIVPQSMRRGLASLIVSRFEDFSRKGKGEIEVWRLLYSAIVIACVLKETTSQYVHHELALAISRSVNDLFVREEGDGSRAWTLVLDIGRRVTVSIANLDSSPASGLAALALALFMKAFERELAQDLIGGEAASDELLIHIATFSQMPDDLRRLASEQLDLEAILKEQPCVVTRPTRFHENSPTLVFLSDTFLADVSFGETEGHSLQVLFGLTIVEVTFQLLRGEVEAETIRPKVVSLVRRAHP